MATAPARSWSRESAEPGILASRLHADGRYANILSVPGSVSSGAVCGRPLLQMEGNAVFKLAVKVLGDVAEETLAAGGLAKSDLDWLIPHQANIRIIQATAKKLGLSMERVVTTVERHANTSAASVPLALDEAVRDGRIRSGQHVLLEGVGGGFTWGAVLMRYGYAGRKSEPMPKTNEMKFALVFPGQGSQAVGMMQPLPHRTWCGTYLRKHRKCSSRICGSSLRKARPTR